MISILSPLLCPMLTNTKGRAAIIPLLVGKITSNKTVLLNFFLLVGGLEYVP